MGFEKIRRPIISPIDNVMSELGAGGGSGSFTTSEVDTGGTWIDGKKIFRKVIDDSAHGTYGTGVTLVPHGLAMANIDRIVRIDGSIKRDIDNQHYPIPWLSPTSSATFGIAISIKDTNLELILAAGWANVAGTRLSSATFIIEYTKVAE